MRGQAFRKFFAEFPMDSDPNGSTERRMLGLRDLCRALFPQVPPSLAEERERAIAEARKMIAVQARGNVSLQSGRFATERDMEQRRERLAKSKL